MTHPHYLIALDQIYHSAWALPRLAAQARLSRLIARRWPGGHPCAMVQVGGTSGKGSVSRFIEAALSLRGVSGSLTSPHLFDFRERFSLDGAWPDQAELARLWERAVLPLALADLQEHGQPLGFQELNLLLALELFELRGVEFAAIEVGVGGQYDPTSAIPVRACALTGVGRDHEHRLGAEPWQRALEKAAMVRHGGILLTTEREPELLRLIHDLCQERGATCLALDPETVDTFWEAAATPLRPDSRLTAPHHRRNAALAFAVAARLAPDLTPAEAVAAMDQVRLLGRLSRVAEGLYIDVAHNPDKIAALASDLDGRFDGRHRHVVAGVSGERGAAEVLGPLLDAADALTLTGAGFKGRDPETLRKELRAAGARIPIGVVEAPQDALAAALERRPERGVVIVTGSSFTIDQALNPNPRLRHLNATYGWRR